MKHGTTGETSEFCRPSGRCDRVGPLLLPLALAIGSPVAALPYALFVWHAPTPKLAALGALCYGLLLALLGRHVVGRFRMRAPGLVLALSIPSLVVGHCFALILMVRRCA